MMNGAVRKIVVLLKGAAPALNTLFQSDARHCLRDTPKLLTRHRPIVHHLSVLVCLYFDCDTRDGYVAAVMNVLERIQR